MQDQGRTVVVACHHKAGSSYIRNTLVKICHLLDWRLEQSGHNEFPNLTQEHNEKCTIYYFSHSNCDLINSLLKERQFHQGKAIHIVRDPRTLVVSAARYHLDSTEAWLDMPLKKYHQATYRSLMLRQRTFDDQLILEMREASRQTLLNMSRINSIIPKLLQFKIEDLSWDTSGLVHSRFAQVLACDPEDRQICQNILLKDSFAMLPKTPSHSRTGMDLNAHEVYGERASREYNRLYKNLHLRLGYRD